MQAALSVIQGIAWLAWGGRGKVTVGVILSEGLIALLVSLKARGVEVMLKGGEGLGGVPIFVFEHNQNLTT